MEPYPPERGHARDPPAVLGRIRPAPAFPDGVPWGCEVGASSQVAMVTLGTDGTHRGGGRSCARGVGHALDPLPDGQAVRSRGRPAARGRVRRRGGGDWMGDRSAGLARIGRGGEGGVGGVSVEPESRRAAAAGGPHVRPRVPLGGYPFFSVTTSQTRVMRVGGRH